MSAAARVFLFFSLGYFVSYVYRGLNIGFAPYLTAEIGLTAADLGTLTSLYFLGFSIAQIPAGMMLDTWGPRRVNAVLLLLAAAGSVAFGLSDTLAGLMAGRLLIGIGVAVCLGATFQALARTFPLARLPLINGLVMAIGGMGGVVVGSPLAALLDVATWREVSVGMALPTVMVAALVWWGTRDAVRTPQGSRVRQGPARQWQGTLELLRDRGFWQLLSLPVMTAGVFFAVQSLWVRPFLVDAKGLAPDHAAALVSVLGFAMVGGNVLLGALARSIEGLGIGLHAFAGLGMVAFISVQLAIMMGLPLPGALAWALYGIFGSAPILLYALLPGRFAPELLGRVNTTANLVMFMMIFACQVGIGAILDLWPNQGGHYPPQAHQAAWGVLLALQAAAAVWYFWPPRKARTGQAG